MKNKLIVVWLISISFLDGKRFKSSSLNYNQTGIKEPNKVCICTLVGSASHNRYLFELTKSTEEQHTNKIYFISTSEKRLLVDAKNISFYDLGYSDHKEDYSVFQKYKRLIGLSASIETTLYRRLYNSYYHKFYKIKEAFLNIQPDFIICDFYAIACIDAARFLNINYVISFQTLYRKEIYTASYFTKDIYSESNTIENKNFVEKIKGLVVYLRSYINNFKLRIELGKLRFDYTGNICYIFGCYNHIEKISDSLLGFEEPKYFKFNELRLFGPLSAQKVQNYSEYNTFLNNHNKILYIAFGSYITLIESKLDTVIESMLYLSKNNFIDGAIWAFGNCNLAYINYKLQRLGLKNIVKLNKWVPQKQILSHKNVKIFYTHGGYESVTESIIGRTPMVVLPFCGDQFKVANNIEKFDIGVKLYHDKITGKVLYKYTKDILVSKAIKIGINKAYVLFLFNTYKIKSARPWIAQKLSLAKMPPYLSTNFLIK